MIPWKSEKQEDKRRYHIIGHEAFGIEFVIYTSNPWTLYFTKNLYLIAQSVLGVRKQKFVLIGRLTLRLTWPFLFYLITLLSNLLFYSDLKGDKIKRQNNIVDWGFPQLAECGFCGSNTVPPDFNVWSVLQSGALPSELKPLGVFDWWRELFKIKLLFIKLYPGGEAMCQDCRDFRAEDLLL